MLRNLILSFCCLFLLQSSASGQDPSQLGSLTKVPASAAYYIATMNHQRLLDAIFDSEAYQYVKNSEMSKGMRKAYRRGKSRGYEEFNSENPIAVYLEYYGVAYSGAVARPIWAVIEEVLGQEFFFYVDKDALAANKAAQNFFGEIMDLIPPEEMNQPNPSDESTELIARAFLQNFQDISCPTFMMGTRLEEPDDMRDLLEFVESSVASAMSDLPEEMDFLASGWRVEKNEERYLMSIRIELADLPLDEVYDEIGNDEITAEIEDFILNKVGTLTLGLTGDQLVFGLSPETEKLAQFGEGEKLIDLPKLNKLRQAIDQNQAITSVYYFSKEYAEANLEFDTVIESYVPMIKAAIEQDESLTEEQKRRFAENAPQDLVQFAKEFKTMIQAPGMTYGFTALGDDGITGYQYADSLHPYLDSSKPLTLSQHASQNNLGFLVQRPSRISKQFEFAVKWSKKGLEYLLEPAMDAVKEAAIRSAKDDEAEIEKAEKTDQLAKEAFDIWGRFANKTIVSMRDKLIPAMENQQAGLFIDVVSNSTLVNEELLGMNLPIPMPALLISSDKMDDVKKFGMEFWNDLEKSISESNQMFSAPGRQEFALMAPTVAIQEDLVLTVSWNIDAPLEPGVNLTITPVIAVGQETLAAGLDQSQAMSLLEPSGANKIFGPASSLEPSSSILFLDNRVLTGYASEMLSSVANKLKDERQEIDLSSYEAERDTLQFSQDQIVDHCQRMIKMIGCFHGASFRSYQSGNGTVTESVLKFKDLETSDE
ncbi:MAG: hypothetical protein AAF939_03715 [Planctomycetota bacterium]